MLGPEYDAPAIRYTGNSCARRVLAPQRLTEEKRVKGKKQKKPRDPGLFN